MSLNEADTCRIYVTPKLLEAGWETSPHSLTEQYTFTDGRVKLTTGDNLVRGERKRADYLLLYNRDYPIAVVEAKPEGETAGNGMQQAKDYAEVLGLKFAYATNGKDILEFDFLTGLEQEITDYPAPTELFARLKQAEGLSDNMSDALLSPYHHVSGLSPRYYQQIAINRTVQAVLQGNRRVLITMATGTGKTLVAFQICWKLWNSRWNRTTQHRKPKILFLADRNVLVDDPKDKTFTPFGEARYKIENGTISKGREMYFAIYQALARDTRRPGLFKEFAPDFFDLIIVDECHRGSARDDSNWREILEYFEPAYQVGMTATPLREDNRDTYSYFGDPIYTYSLKEGIDDGFLAPYRVHRVITDVDASGWRPSTDELDRYGQEIPDGEYQTRDFERIIALRARTRVIARHLSDFLKRNDRFAKTVVFCVNQEHADEMRRELNNLNADLVQTYPDYVTRVTSEEGKVGRRHLGRFQEIETMSPVILTTSHLLTTGVDAPTCKNVVLARMVNSMTEFKQIIGRGTRLRSDYGKYWFNIIDYTGSAISNFADPDFDGFPDIDEETHIDDQGNTIDDEEAETTDQQDLDLGDDNQTEEEGGYINLGDDDHAPRKYYVDNGFFEITSHLVYELDTDGTQLRVIQYTDYTAEKVRTLFVSDEKLRDLWASPVQREDILTLLEERGIDFRRLAETTNNPEADPLDLLCHLAFGAPLRTRRERADYLRRNNPDFFDLYGPEAREVLDTLLDKYIEYGPRQFEIPDSLQVPPISERGNVMEITTFFGNATRMRQAVNQMQALLYAH